MCFWKESSFRSKTAATPPCAYFVLDSDWCALVTTVIFFFGNCSASFTASVNPAAPEPIIRKLVSIAILIIQAFVQWAQWPFYGLPRKPQYEAFRLADSRTVFGGCSSS